MKTKPKIEIDLDEVARLAECGLTQGEISDALGISSRTFYNRKAQVAEFAEKVKQGRARGVVIATNALWQLIEDGNFAAIRFFLKAKAGWSETPQFEHDASGQITLTITRPHEKSNQIRLLAAATEGGEHD